MKIPITILCALIISLSLVSGVIINSVDSENLAPGKQGQIRIEIENILSDDVGDVSLSLDFSGLPITPVGTSTMSTDEIEEDEEEDFFYTARAANDATPGDYEIPYKLSYTIRGETEEKLREGTIGITVSAEPDLDFSINSENAVIGMSGQVSLKIVNKGFSNARFVSVKVLQRDFTLLSDNEEYIGEIESDDFETVNFDVRFNKKNSHLEALVEYRNFDNEKVIESIDLPLKVYTREEALQNGIIQKSSIPTIISVVILLVLLIILWRYWKKRQRLKRSMRLNDMRREKDG